MVALKDFREDYKWIAHRALPPISPSEAREAVGILLELGMLNRDKEGNLKQVEKHVQTEGRNTQVQEAFHFHEAVLNQARHALGLIPHDERHFHSLTLPLPKSLFADIVNDFIEFKDRILKRVEKNKCSADEVYLINFQVYPATQKGGIL